jgi:hypothetical protein
MLTKQGIIATIANLASLRPYNIVSHHTKCQERNGNNNWGEEFSCRFYYGALQKAVTYQH